MEGRKSCDDPETWKSFFLFRRGFDRTQCGVRCSQTRDRNAERRAAHVVQPELVAELHRGWIAPVLAADAEMDIRPHRAALLHGQAHQRPNPLAVERRERVD